MGLLNRDVPADPERHPQVRARDVAPAAEAIQSLGILEEADKELFAALLQGADGLRGEADAGAHPLGRLASYRLEGEAVRVEACQGPRVGVAATGSTRAAGGGDSSHVEAARVHSALSASGSTSLAAALSE